MRHSEPAVEQAAIAPRGQGGTKAAAATCGPVIENGRVLDLGSGQDVRLNFGIPDGQAVQIMRENPEGAEEFNASGYMVAPAFIDLHTHSAFPFGRLLQPRTGVTTALAPEAGAFPADAQGPFVRDQVYGNYGSSVCLLAVGIKVIEGKEQPNILFREKGQMIPGAAFSDVAIAE